MNEAIINRACDRYGHNRQKILPLALWITRKGKKEKIIAEIRFARRKMLIGAIFGFALFYLFSMFMLYINGWLAADLR
jgi:hypothetical protein